MKSPALTTPDCTLPYASDWEDRNRADLGGGEGGGLAGVVREGGAVGDRTSMKAPPPTPLDAGLTTPRQSDAATAASTALPPSRSASRPILEHRPSSAATAPCGEVTTSLRPAAAAAAAAKRRSTSRAVAAHL